jgi:hypothetical protein
MQNRTSRIGLTEEDRQNKTVRTGQAELNSRTRQAEQEWQTRTERTVRDGFQDRTAKTGLPK